MGLSTRNAPSHEATEVQSSITLQDFFQVWTRHRVLFLLGLIIIVLATVVWSKFFLTKYYRAQSTIFIGNRVSPDQRIGFSEIDKPPAGRNDQYFNARDAAVAEQYLNSPELLLEAARRLKLPDGNVRG